MDATVIVGLLDLMPHLTSLQIVDFKHPVVLDRVVAFLALSASLSRLTQLKLECAETGTESGGACGEGLKRLLWGLFELREIELNVVVDSVWRTRDDLPRCRLRRITLGARAQAALIPFSYTSSTSLLSLKLNLKSGWALPPAFTLETFQQLQEIQLDEAPTTKLQRLVDQVSNMPTLRHFIILHGTGPSLADIGFARLPPTLTVLILDLPVPSSEIFQLVFHPRFDRCKIVWRDAGKAWTESDLNVVRQMAMARERRNEGKEWAAMATASVVKR
ncbi:hypothetical protein BCR35DRAFT_331803 [Leucosporidium creatinivorum]|uniref:F-box domain-containing protein n=1 Tax=Leucosporidium creatinivorum TaxID=106004 RepID=A0A1Y2FA06_9BASI|nr:hypothetical protein BCR35DRAFT_331803 [Leucosporidium creatinivorum]